MNCPDLNLTIGLCSSFEHQIVGSILGWNDLNECFEQQLKIHYDKKEVNFMLNNQHLCDNDYFWRNVILTDELLSQTKITQNWKVISKNSSLTLELALKYKDKLNGYWSNLLDNTNISWNELETKLEVKNMSMDNNDRMDIPERYVKEHFNDFKQNDCFSSVCSETFWKEHINEWCPTMGLQESQAEIIIKLKPNVKLYRSEFMSDEFVKRHKDNIEDNEIDDDADYLNKNDGVIYLDKNDKFNNMSDYEKVKYVNNYVMYLSEHDLELHSPHITNWQEAKQNNMLSECFFKKHKRAMCIVLYDVLEHHETEEIPPAVSGEFYLKHLELSTYGKHILKHEYFIHSTKIREFISYLKFCP
ncbi:Uncharacterised protein [uncultured archaeon]|nr:Uncharacterised protein [uncultured archaeon]